jgi:hypothetical protein
VELAHHMVAAGKKYWAFNLEYINKYTCMSKSLRTGTYKSRYNKFYKDRVHN